MFLQWSAALQDRSNKTVFDCGGMIWLWLSLVSEPPERGDSSSLVEKEQRVPGSGLSRLWNRSLYDWPAFDGWLQQGISTSPLLLRPSNQGQREQGVHRRPGVRSFLHMYVYIYILHVYISYLLFMNKHPACPANNLSIYSNTFYLFPHAGS